jgi:hypothetical protein
MSGSIAGAWARLAFVVALALIFFFGVPDAAVPVRVIGIACLLLLLVLALLRLRRARDTSRDRPPRGDLGS